MCFEVSLYFDDDRMGSFALSFGIVWYCGFFGLSFPDIQSVKLRTRPLFSECRKVCRIQCCFRQVKTFDVLTTLRFSHDLRMEVNLEQHY